MPRIDLDILNQKQTPAFYASSLATRPAASFVGRIFIDSDNPSTGLYRDTGTAWVQIADPGAGTTGTLQQVTTNGSSTTVGISTSGNGIGIGTTIPASNRLDIHSGTGLQATFNGTGVTNAAIQLQLAGVGKWTLQNNYNAAANDFVITDVLNTLPRLTIKNTGQSFFGTVVTSSGLLVVNSSTSDNHFVAIGANAPSLRLRDAGSGGVLSCGVGISTATNNFIQGSASGNYCIFNSSTTASPILFGVYDAGTGNTQEAVRISDARNLLVGTTLDSGDKLRVAGSAVISLNLQANQGNFINASVPAINAIRNLDVTISGTAGQGIEFGAFNGLVQTTGAAIYGVLDNPATTGYLVFQTRNAGTVTTRMTIKTTGILNITNTPIYATNALALAGGLVAGDIYKSATGVISIVF